MIKIINKKRKLKRKKLIKKLFLNILKNKIVNKTKIRIVDREDYPRNKSSFVIHKNNNTKHTVTINLLGLKDRIKNGYDDSYYSDRPKRLDFVKKNRKIALRFVLLHELGHCILREQDNNSEFNADSYAIDILKNEGIIK